MISPLRCPHNFKSTTALKKIIEPRSIVGSYLFYDGNLELGISSKDRMVVSHTNNYTISEFWACARFDPPRLVELIEHLMRFREVKLFHAMQEAWSGYKDPFVRAAIFFILNRCSEEGMISKGEINFDRYNALCLSRLRPLKDMQYFHLMRTREYDFLKSIESDPETEKYDYLLFPVGKFSYNLFEDGKSAGHEETKVNHSDIENFFKKQNQKSILVYKAHNELQEIYKDYKILMIDKHGNNTNKKDLCEDMIIANF